MPWVKVAWRSPQTMCFSSVEIDPLQAMSIITYYKFNKRRPMSLISIGHT